MAGTVTLDDIINDATHGLNLGSTIRIAGLITRKIREESLCGVIPTRMALDIAITVLEEEIELLEIRIAELKS